MATKGEGRYDQGRSTIRRPLFRGTNFSYWKNLMQIFIKTKDYGPVLFMGKLGG